MTTRMFSKMVYIGQINTFEQLKPGAVPKFCKARPVPFALKAAVERELDRLESEGILDKVQYNEWVAPVVPVPKTEGTIRLCGDYKVTINPQLEVHQYPLPKPDNIFATLAEGKWFSKIDLKHAYQQMTLAENSGQYVTINTHFVVLLYPSTFWCSLGTSTVSKSDGYRVTRVTQGDLLSG